MVNQETSNVISVLKCLLCIGVVCIHSTFNEDSLGVSGNDISHFLIFSDFFVIRDKFRNLNDSTMIGLLFMHFYFNI